MIQLHYSSILFFFMDVVILYYDFFIIGDYEEVQYEIDKVISYLLFHSMYM